MSSEEGAARSLHPGTAEQLRTEKDLTYLKVRRNIQCPSCASSSLFSTRATRIYYLEYVRMSKLMLGLNAISLSLVMSLNELMLLEDVGNLSQQLELAEQSQYLYFY